MMICRIILRSPLVIQEGVEDKAKHVVILGLQHPDSK